MRHRKSNKKLNKPTDQRLALLKNLAVSLIEHSRIITTQTRAKQAQRFVELLITKSKVDSVENRRYIMKKLNNKVALKKLFSISQNYTDRKGGYTKLINVGFRRGDSATLSLVEFVN